LDGAPLASRSPPLGAGLAARLFLGVALVIQLEEPLQDLTSGQR
jgi:hypothetical protein